MTALPLCPECREILRPDAVLYEEQLPDDALEHFELEQDRGFYLVFSVGTTSVFYYVTQPVAAAARSGVPVVEINPEETTISDLADFRFVEPAGRTMQVLLEAVNGGSSMS
jgi:NAD-dependent deacetylase